MAGARLGTCFGTTFLAPAHNVCSSAGSWFPILTSGGKIMIRPLNRESDSRGLKLWQLRVVPFALIIRLEEGSTGGLL